jgi:hypothetical protein
MASILRATLVLAFSLSVGTGCIDPADDIELGEMTSAVSVTWTDVRKVTPSGASITKTSGANTWDAGAVSTQTLNGDGYVEFTTGENTTNKFAGLSNGNATTNYTEIDYAFYLQANGFVRIYENGVQRLVLGTYTPGDTFRIDVIGGQVSYRMRGQLVYQSTIAPTLPLLLDTSLYSIGATVQNAQIFADGGAPGWQNPIGVVTTPDSLTKTGVIGWNAGASSTASLSGDGYVEFSSAETTSNKFAGLSNGDASTGYADIDYAFYLQDNGHIRVYENGVLRKNLGSYTPGEVFRVELVGTEVRYLVSGAIVYRSTVTPVLPLVLDTALYTPGATIQGVRVGTSASTPFWESPVGVALAGTGLTKTAATGWNAGASTVRNLSGDGHVTFITGEVSTAKFAGLSNGNPGTSYTEIDYAFYLLDNGTVRIYESGTLRAVIGTYVAGDTFDIGVVGGTVQYSVNGTVVYTSTMPPTFPLVLDTALYTAGATIQNVMFSP